MILETLAESELCQRLWLALLHSLWQATAITAIVAVALVALRRAAAGVRYAVSVSGMVLITAALPATFWWVDVSRPAIPPPSGTGPTAERAAGAAARPLPGRASRAVPADSPASTLGRAATTRARQPVWLAMPGLRSTALAPIGVPIYLGGVMCMLARLSLSLYAARRLQRSAVPVTDPQILAVLAEQAQHWRWSSVPLVAICDRVVVPLVVGVLRPVIEAQSPRGP